MSDNIINTTTVLRWELEDSPPEPSHVTVVPYPELSVRSRLLAEVPRGDHVTLRHPLFIEARALGHTSLLGNIVQSVWMRPL